MLPGRIGRYEVLGRLAAGGMAEILLARLSGPANFERAVVIKRILRTYATNDSFVQMFLNEARIVASLRHPNIVHVQELGEHDGEAFLVMEYVAGENASSWLKRCVSSSTPFDPVLAAHIVAETCAGLHAAHELTDDGGKAQNLVHRDVSPQNILVGYDGHVKLVDFGVALVERRTAFTEPGELKGKLAYMSPEQGRGKPLDRRSDLFALGIVLYELSTGRRLFERPSALRCIDAICREPVVPPSRVYHGAAPYPANLEAIVMRALAKDPDARYQTAAEMRLALLEVVRELRTPVEALAAEMQRLFPDRIAEKQEMLRKVSNGEDLTHVPAGETDLDVEVPPAPEANGTEATLLVTDPRSGTALARRWRATAIAMAIGALVLAFTVVVAARRSAKPMEEASPSSASAAPAPVVSSSASASEEIVVHVESKPPAARVVMHGRDSGTTPLDLRLARSSQRVELEIVKDGFEPSTQPIVPDVDQKVSVGLRPKPAAAKPRAHSSTPAVRPSVSAGGFRRFD